MLIYVIKCVKMKNKILNLAMSAVWLVLCMFVGLLIFRGVLSLTDSNDPAKKIGMSVFTEEGHETWCLRCSRRKLPLP